MLQWLPKMLLVLTIAFIILFFMRYFVKMRPKKRTLEWVKMRDKPRFSLERKGKMDKWDWLMMGGITLLYAILTFVNLGDMEAPQSFTHFDASMNSVTIFIDEPSEIDVVFYYTGLYHGGTDSIKAHRAYRLEFSSDGTNWTQQSWTGKEDSMTEEGLIHAMQQKHSNTFRWLYARLIGNNPVDVRYVRITALKNPMELGEVCLTRKLPDGTREIIPAALLRASAGGEGLIDEQGVIPPDYNIMNSTHFDEIYHAYSAYEHANNIYPYERTHPPLGKELTALGIWMFGMTPFGWRFMPALFGVLMLPLLYMLLCWMFGKRTVTICGTLLFTFEFMHFVQTRISTIDVYGVFFILLTYMLMYRYITSGNEAPFRETALPLLLCGAAFGLGVASKWIVVYGGIGLVILYALYLYRRMRHARRNEQAFAPFLLKTLAVSVLGFGVLGGGFYVLSYIPYALSARNAPNFFGTEGGGVAALIAATGKEWWANQQYMLEYHGKSVLGAVHSWSSRWYQWMFNEKPILYYRHNVDAEGTRASLWAFTNPMNTWGGLLALAACVYGVVMRRRATAWFILIGYFSQLVPWMPIERLTFPYHYFPSILFCCIALAYVFDELLERDAKNVRYVYAFTGVTIGLFVLFYPVLTGIPAPSWYGEAFLQWLPQWTM